MNCPNQSRNCLQISLSKSGCVDYLLIIVFVLKVSSSCPIILWQVLIQYHFMEITEYYIDRK